MYLIYYIKDGVKGWFLGETKIKLQQWAYENLDTTMSGEDEYEIVDLARRDLQRELADCKEKLRAIKELCK